MTTGPRSSYFRWSRVLFRMLGHLQKVHAEGLRVLVLFRHGPYYIQGLQKLEWLFLVREDGSGAAFAVVALPRGNAFDAWENCRAAYHSALPGGYCLPLVVYIGSLVKSTCCSRARLQFFGDFSYPLYILHQPFLLVWGGHTAHRLCAVHPVATQLSIPIFCFAVAGISWGVSLSTISRSVLVSHRLRQ